MVNLGARPVPAVVAALSLNAMLGSLYAWSIFVLPVERDLGVMRAQSSAVFATAGYANPTLTIVTLALRLSDHLRKVLV